MERQIQGQKTELLSVIGKKANLTELYKITDSHINQIRDVQERSKIARDEVNDLVMRFRNLQCVEQKDFDDQMYQNRNSIDEILNRIRVLEEEVDVDGSQIGDSLEDVAGEINSEDFDKKSKGSYQGQTSRPGLHDKADERSNKSGSKVGRGSHLGPLDGVHNKTGPR